MAKKQVFVREFPSDFGSHKVMIDEAETDKLGEDKTQTHVVLRDEHGTYVTEWDRLDNGCADPNRYAESRLDKLFVKHGKEE